MAKTYEVKFKEFDKNEGQEMQVRTNDIEFTVEQICRNRNSISRFIFLTCSVSWYSPVFLFSIIIYVLRIHLL